MSENFDITFIRPEHRAAMQLWKTIRDVCRGADAVKGAGHAYLPRLDQIGTKTNWLKHFRDDKSTAGVLINIGGTTSS